MESVVATYGDLLKDRRWQRKRLEIFQRDDWTCQYCSRTAIPLNVHYIKYVGENPWRTLNKYLVTLCENCHKDETDLKWCDIIQAVTAAGVTRIRVRWLLRFELGVEFPPNE